MRWGCAVQCCCCCYLLHLLEGPEGRVILLGWRSNMERSGLFSSRNWLSRHDIQLGIKLFQDMVAGATYSGVGPESVSRWAELSSEIIDGFKKNQLIPLNITARDYKYWRITEFGAIWVMIWRLINFFTEIFQLFLRGEIS